MQMNSKLTQKVNKPWQDTQNSVNNLIIYSFTAINLSCVESRKYFLCIKCNKLPEKKKLEDKNKHGRKLKQKKNASFANKYMHFFKKTVPFVVGSLAIIN